MKKAFYSVFGITLFLAPASINIIENTSISVSAENTKCDSASGWNNSQLNGENNCYKTEFVVNLHPLITELNITASLF